MLCLYCTSKSYYLHGGILSEIPFIPGNDKSSDGPKKLIKTIPNHEILNDVQTFSGGSGSFRASIQTIAAKPNEEISTIGTWNDDEKTPLIITKRYFGGEKQNYGNLVVLNFWPASSTIDSSHWDSNTDGDKILQNAVTWSAEKFIQIQIRNEQELETQKHKSESWDKIKKILDEI